MHIYIEFQCQVQLISFSLEECTVHSVSTINAISENFSFKMGSQTGNLFSFFFFPRQFTHETTSLQRKMKESFPSQLFCVSNHRLIHFFFHSFSYTQVETGTFIKCIINHMYCSILQGSCCRSDDSTYCLVCCLVFNIKRH